MPGRPARPWARGYGAACGRRGVLPSRGATASGAREQQPCWAVKGVSTCPARLLPPPRLGPRAGVCARPAWRVCGSLGGSFCPLGGRLAAAAPYFAANSALVLLLLLLRRAEAACRDGGEGAGVRGWVCCDGVPSLVGGGWRVRELWRRGGGGTMQLHFYHSRPILPRNPSVSCLRSTISLPLGLPAQLAPARTALMRRPRG